MIKVNDKQGEPDPFQCTCAPCKRFWKDCLPGQHHLVSQPPLERASKTSILYQSNQKTPSHPGTIKVGHRVLVNGKHTGRVRYVGVLTDQVIAPEVYVGVQLDDNIGSKQNGVHNGKRYFHCPRGQGALVPYPQVVRLNPPEDRPPVSGNFMYPSYEEVVSRRQERAKMDPFFYLGPSYTGVKSEDIFRTPGARPEPKIHVFDKHDIAYTDAVKRERLQQERQIAELQLRLFAEQRSQESTRQEWENRFGAGSRGKTLANTLLKLRAARQQGEKECSRSSDVKSVRYAQEDDFEE